MYRNHLIGLVRNSIKAGTPLHRYRRKCNHWHSKLNTKTFLVYSSKVLYTRYTGSNCRAWGHVGWSGGGGWVGLPWRSVCQKFCQSWCFQTRKMVLHDVFIPPLSTHPTPRANYQQYPKKQQQAAEAASSSSKWLACSCLT